MGRLRVLAEGMGEGTEGWVENRQQLHQLPVLATQVAMLLS